MKKIYRAIFNKFFFISIVISIPLSSNANFYIDYQGVSIEKTTPEDLRKLNGAPDGYRILADKTFDVVHQVGTGVVKNIETFGRGLALKDTISMLIPDKWIAYIDENSQNDKNIDFLANDEPWISVLTRIGINYGYRFVVDWDQNLLQISLDEGFVAPDYNDPITLKDPNSGRTIFVYSAKPISKDGVILINGKSTTIK